MVRAVLACVLGYLVMVLVVFGSFSAMLLILGVDGSFKEGTWEISQTWLIGSFVLGLVAAVAGGLVCGAIARAGSKAPMALAAIVLGLGMLMAIPALMASSSDETEARPSDVPMADAMMNAQQPVIAAIGNPIVGAIGVIIGAAMVRKKAPKTT